MASSGFRVQRDPSTEPIDAFVPDATAFNYRSTTRVCSGRVDVPCCPGLSLDMDGLWAKVDELE